MNKSERGKLARRWTTQQSNAGLAFLLGKGAPPFQRLDDGQNDLRGLPITQVIRNATISDMDLSGATLEGFGQFGMCRVEHCCFRNSQLTTNLGHLFQACDFTSAKLTGAVLWGQFCDCDFSSANLSSASGNQTKFIRCVFSRTNFRKAHLLHCAFEDCTFEHCTFGSGSLAFSKFERSPLDLDGLGNTLIEKVTMN